MSGLDMSVAYYPVLMIAGKRKKIPQYALADGYRFVPYDPSYKKGWIHLHVALGQLKSFAHARHYFEQTFEAYPDTLSKQMILVVDANEQLIGSSSLWMGQHFGVEKLRIHWLGVDHKHQRKGIAKALLCRSMQLHSELNTKEPLYLTTQTNSYKAIRMYKHFGFEPYMGDMPIHFQGKRDTFLQDNETAWKIIDDKIKELEQSICKMKRDEV